MYRFSLVAFLLILGACSPLQHIEKTKNNAQISSSESVKAPYRATATKYWELIHTDIDISFDLAQKEAKATTKLSLHPYFYSTDSVVLDAKDMKILAITDQDNDDLSYQYNQSQLIIKLTHNYQKKDTLLLTIKYIAMPYAHRPAGGGSAISEDRGLYFINTDYAEPYQPVQIWTQGETESNSHWFPTFDKPNYRSTFQITMHVPDSFTTLSNGIKIKTKSEDQHLKAVTWQQSLPIPPYLVMMAAGNFYEAKGQWNGKEVNYYVPQNYAAYAKDIFKHTPEMMDYFSEILGVPFPWAKYSQVVVYDYVSGAMENVSAGLFGSFNLKDNRELKDNSNDFIVAHELFHQWFGDYVTCENWSQITLNESFADFSEKLWSEHKYGKDKAQIRHLKSLNQYLNQALTNDPPLVRFHYKNELEVFDRTSYSKGGLILNYLRRIMGDEAFFASLHLYLNQNALHSAEVSQLRLSIEAITGEDWNWFFNQWYFRGGHPELSVNYKYDDLKKEVTATVTQIQKGMLYHLPLKASIIRNGQSEKVDWLIKDKIQSFVYPYKNDSRPVIIPDADHWLPGIIIDHKKAWQWLIQFKYAEDLIGKYDALLATKDKTINSDSVAMLFNLAFQDGKAFIRKSAVELIDFNILKFKKQFTSQIGNLAQNDSDNAVKAAALYKLESIQDASFASTYDKAVFDSSYLVAAAGLAALDKVNHKRALDYALSLLQINANSALWLTTAGKVIGKEGNADDYSFYENTILHLFERRRELFMNAFVVYLNHVKSEDVYKDGINLIQKVANRNTSEHATFILSASLYRLSEYAELTSKAASDKQEIQKWERCKTAALNAWNAYKATVKNKAILNQIAQLEQK